MIKKKKKITHGDDNNNDKSFILLMEDIEKWLNKADKEINQPKDEFIFQKFHQQRMLKGIIPLITEYRPCHDDKIMLSIKTKYHWNSWNCGRCGISIDAYGNPGGIYRTYYNNPNSKQNMCHHNPLHVRCLIGWFNRGSKCVYCHANTLKIGDDSDLSLSDTQSLIKQFIEIVHFSVDNKYLIGDSNGKIWWIMTKDILQFLKKYRKKMSDEVFEKLINSTIKINDTIEPTEGWIYKSPIVAHKYLNDSRQILRINDIKDDIFLCNVKRQKYLKLLKQRRLEDDEDYEDSLVDPKEFGIDLDENETLYYKYTKLSFKYPKHYKQSVIFTRQEIYAGGSLNHGWIRNKNCTIFQNDFKPFVHDIYDKNGQFTKMFIKFWKDRKLPEVDFEEQRKYKTAYNHNLLIKEFTNIMDKIEFEANLQKHDDDDVLVGDIDDNIKDDNNLTIGDVKKFRDDRYQSLHQCVNVHPNARAKGYFGRSNYYMDEEAIKFGKTRSVEPNMLNINELFHSFLTLKWFIIKCLNVISDHTLSHYPIYSTTNDNQTEFEEKLKQLLKCMQLQITIYKHGHEIQWHQSIQDGFPILIISLKNVNYHLPNGIYLSGVKTEFDIVFDKGDLLCLDKGGFMEKYYKHCIKHYNNREPDINEERISAQLRFCNDEQITENIK